MSYQLTWSRLDKADIMAELAWLRAHGHDEEIARVLAFMSALAKAGHHARDQNIHTNITGRPLHSACPFGTVGVFYAYQTPPTGHIYILAFCLDVYLYFPTAAARLSNVP